MDYTAGAPAGGGAAHTGPADPGEWLEYQFSKRKTALMKRNKWAAVVLIVFLFIILMFVSIAFIPAQESSPDDSPLRTFDTQQHTVDMSTVLGSTYMEVLVELNSGAADFFLLDEDGYDASYPHHEAMREQAIEYKYQAGWFEYKGTQAPGIYYIIITRASQETTYKFTSTHFPYRPLLIPGLIVGLTGTILGAVLFSRTRKDLRALLRELKIAQAKLQQQQYKGIYGGAGAPPGAPGGRMPPGPGGPGAGGPPRGGYPPY